MLFGLDYHRARQAFRDAARQSGARMRSVDHKDRAPCDGDLAVDVARFGADNPESIVFLTSGMHGVELTAGTQCQVDLMTSGRLAELGTRTAVVLIHAANPWGAAHDRRYTEENVDLCRNFLPFPVPPGVPEGFDALREAINVAPNDRKALVEADHLIERFAQGNGIGAFYHAVMAGQYRDADGIGFGGFGPTWSRQTLERILRTEAGDAETIVTLDYHTGVGPYAYGCIVAMQTGPRLSHVEPYFGPWIMAPRENPPPGFIDVTGHSGDGYEALFPERDVIAGVLEVGTYSQRSFLDRLIDEHRWTRVCGDDPQQPELQAARKALKGFFIPADPHWQAYVRHRGRQAFEQIMERLSHDD